MLNVVILKKDRLTSRNFSLRNDFQFPKIRESE